MDGPSEPVIPYPAFLQCGQSTNQFASVSYQVLEGARTYHKSSNINIIMTPTTHHHQLKEVGSWSEQERPRSRSIAIVKRHRSSANASQKDSDTAASYNESPSDHGESMYDWATWCLYNRIIDHRRNSIIRSISVESHVSKPSQHQFVLTRENGSTVHSSELQESNVVEPASPWDYYRDGEIFELEI